MTVATFMFGFFVGGCTGVIVAALFENRRPRR